MPPKGALSSDAVLRLPPMLFGRIRWSKGLGQPVGDPCSGFTIQAQEHTASQFRIGASGPEVIPGTGVWKAPVSVPCSTAPDEGDMHVVTFNVPNVHLNMFPDGKYRVSAQLTGNWAESRVQAMLGYRRIEPLSFYVALTKDSHLASVDFEVIQEPWRFRVG